MIFNKIKRSLCSIALSLCFFNHATTVCITKKNTVFGLLAITIAYCVGKTVHQLYNHYATPNNSFIEYCNSDYKKISQEIHDCLNNYYTASQMSDLSLKEMIYLYEQEPYPFMRYQETIAQELKKFKTYFLIAQKNLKKIQTIKYIPEYTEIIDMLEIQGKAIVKKLALINVLLTTLNQRVRAFREYTEDCSNYSYN